MTARADTAEQRLATYRGLMARNRLVGILRIGLPALGVLVFVIFVLQILVASLDSQFGLGSVSFSGDTITVDTPSYSGVMANGDVYKVSAEGAQTTITNLNLIELRNPTLRLTRPNGNTLLARAPTGDFETLGQRMSVAGTAEISDSEGNAGTLQDLTVSLPEQRLVAKGRAQITLKGGMTIDGAGLSYDAKRSVWTFGATTVVLPQLPDDDAPADDGAPATGNAPVPGEAVP